MCRHVGHLLGASAGATLHGEKRGTRCKTHPCNIQPRTNATINQSDDDNVKCRFEIIFCRNTRILVPEVRSILLNDRWPFQISGEIVNLSLQTFVQFLYDFSTLGDWMRPPNPIIDVRPWVIWKKYCPRLTAWYGIWCLCMSVYKLLFVSWCRRCGLMIVSLWCCHLALCTYSLSLSLYI